jgi:hypothetical protein
MEDPGVRTHDGFYLRMALGYASLSATVEDKESSTKLDLTGGGLAVELAVGGTVAPGLVLGVGSYGAAIFSPEYEYGGSTFDGETLTLSSIGPFIDYYFDPKGGGHIQAAVAFATFSQPEGEDINSDLDGTGYSLMLGGGYDWWVGDQWSIGLLARVQYYNLTVEDEDGYEADVTGFVPAILLSFTYH